MPDVHAATVTPPREATPRVFARYLLFQTPGWGVAAALCGVAVEWGGVAPSLAWLAGGAWLVKDLVMFPFVRRAYERDRPSHGAVGAHGVADGAIDPEGWIHIGPERWRARLTPGAAPIEAGAEVEVVAVEGLVVRVRSPGPA